MSDSECCFLISPLIGKRLDEEICLGWKVESGELCLIANTSDNLESIIYKSLSDLILDVRRIYNLIEEGKSLSAVRGNVFYEITLRKKMYYQNTN